MNALRHLLCVVGARPNFIKIAPIMAALRESSIRAELIHTGQHYDVAMNDTFFQQLEIPAPDVSLGVGSGSHAQQTAEVMKGFDAVLDRSAADGVLVVGDVNSTIACALVAAKRDVRVIHVEAGLRSGDRRMPEEVNRVLTDQISDLLFTTERSALDNLRREGIDERRVHFVGNVMIDTLFRCRKRAVPPRESLGKAGYEGALERIEKEGYVLLTLHRPSNVDDPETLRGLLSAIGELSERIPFVFPVHPRTRSRIEALGLGALLASSRIFALPPLGYLETLGLMQQARWVMTDSGGLQEETTALQVPCLTLREHTERPITVTEGSNRIVGVAPAAVVRAATDLLEAKAFPGRVPELWDGQSAKRIVAVLENPQSFLPF